MIVSKPCLALSNDHIKIMVIVHGFVSHIRHLSVGHTNHLAVLIYKGQSD